MEPAPPGRNKKSIPGIGYALKDTKLYLPALALPRSGSKGIISARDHYAPSTPESIVAILFQTPSRIKKKETRGKGTLVKC